MTDRIIVSTFDSTNAAYDAASAIKDLKKRGIADFKLKAGVMVGKDDRGNLSVLETRDRSLLGTAVGTVVLALCVDHFAGGIQRQCEGARIVDALRHYPGR